MKFQSACFDSQKWSVPPLLLNYTGISPEAALPTGDVFRLHYILRLFNEIYPATVEWIYRFVTTVYWYNYYHSGHYTLYCLLKTELNGNWTLSPSSGSIYRICPTEYRLKTITQSNLRNFSCYITLHYRIIYEFYPATVECAQLSIAWRQ
jgi:hypothetical protein